MRAGMSKLFATLLVLASIGAAQAQTLRIQYAEPIELAPTAGRAQFDAYGRRFTLELENNDVILGKLPAARKAQVRTQRIRAAQASRPALRAKAQRIRILSRAIRLRLRPNSCF